jgi:Xaa-Pro dipeptidase
VYPHQIDRLTETLEREGLSAFVATSAENVFYMTGFRSLNHAIFRAQQFAVWTPRGVALVVPAVDIPHIMDEATPADHVMGFGGFVCSYADALGPEEQGIRERTESRAPSPGHAIGSALEALEVRDGRIGLDESNLTPAAWERLTNMGGLAAGPPSPPDARRAPGNPGRSSRYPDMPLAGYTVVPAAAALLTARRVKSPYEIECLGRALGIAEEALNAVLQMLKPLVTEREAAALYQTEVLKRDASLYPSSIAFGERTWIALAPPTERALKMGELARFDVGAIFKGYYSSVARTAVMGEPSPRQLAAAEAVQAGLEAGIDAVKPGATAGQVYDAVMTATRAAGLPNFQRGHVGHAIGLEPYERPKLDAGKSTPLEAGEVLRIEVPHLELGWGGVALRDTVLVTTTASRVLNRSARGLVVLD